MIAAAIALAPAARAQGGQGWVLCNETSYILEAAAARPDARSVLVQGWIRLRPGECRIAAPQPLTRAVHYVHARTSLAHRGGRRQWGGDATLCVDPQSDFSITNPASCAQMGFVDRQFRRVQINKTDGWRTRFIEAQSYTLFRARAAGLQQLLADAGYDTGGDRRASDPRRTAVAIAQFRAEAGLAAEASEEELIDRLEQAALRRAEEVGLRICNRTENRMWTAIARRRGEGWESRGWWSLEPAGCVRTIDDPLIQGVYFVHATLDTTQGERQLAAGGEPFCISPSRFAILGRTRCPERYYQTALFTRISSSGDEALTVAFQDADFLAPGLAARRIDPPRTEEPAVDSADRGVARGAAPSAAAPGPQARPSGAQGRIRDLVAGEGGPTPPGAPAPPVRRPPPAAPPAQPAP